MQEEIWKDIPNYEGMYQVSNIGRVKSLRCINNNHITLKCRIDKDGYRCVVFSVNGKGKYLKVHQLVAMAFLNHVPCGHKIIVDHIDNNKLNNNINNLQLTTPRHNVSKSIDKSKTSSKYIGVYWVESRKRWRSEIRINGKKKHLGTFTEEDEAAKAYQEALANL